MADDDIYDIRKDLPMSMTIAAFIGISWFIGLEINTSLFLLFKRRRSLYFWSAALASWGVILQPLFIILADFGVWTDLKGSITMIYLTWLIMVIPQSWLLYSRLYLIADNATMLRWIKIVLVFTSIVFSVPTIIIGTIAQATDISPGLFQINLAWDRVQLTVYFVQETALSLLYIWQARKYLRNSSLLSKPYLVTTTTTRNNNTNDDGTGPATTTTTTTRAAPETKQVLRDLVLANLLVISLDIALLGVQYANLFYLQGAFKTCVYGVKLKVEFAILNRLVEIVRRRGRGGAGYDDSSTPSAWSNDGPGGNGGGTGLFRTTGTGTGTIGGGGLPKSASSKSVSAAGRSASQQQQQQATAYHRTTETEWEQDDDEADDEVGSGGSGSRHLHRRQPEQIGLGDLHHRTAVVGGAGGSRSHSQESQGPIWAQA